MPFEIDLRYLKQFGRNEESLWKTRIIICQIRRFCINLVISNLKCYYLKMNIERLDRSGTTKAKYLNKTETLS